MITSRSLPFIVLTHPMGASHIYHVNYELAGRLIDTRTSPPMVSFDGHQPRRLTESNLEVLIAMDQLQRPTLDTRQDKTPAPSFADVLAAAGRPQSSENAAHKIIMELRKALFDDDQAPDLLRNIRGHGYMLCGTLTRVGRPIEVDQIYLHSKAFPELNRPWKLDDALLVRQVLSSFESYVAEVIGNNHIARVLECSVEHEGLTLNPGGSFMEQSVSPGDRIQLVALPAGHRRP